MEKLQPYLAKLTDMAVAYAPKVLLALITLWIGIKVINWISRHIRKSMEKKDMEATLAKFLSNLISWVLKIALFLTVAGMFGVETTSFIAILGAAGLAIGLALQGALANFAGGVLILLFKPYKVGDLIESQGRIGVVKEIQLFTTLLDSPENKTVILPNGAVSNNDIVNYTTNGLIRVDLNIGVSYNADLQLAREVLMDVMTKHPNVVKEPAPFVGITELADSAVNLAVRPYCHPDDYWNVYFDVYEQGKQAIENAGIEIPFPQMDVHLEQKS